MLTNLAYLIFILSVAMAAGGVVLSTKLRSSHENQVFSTLLYFQVFIYTFGFYGIWGQVAIRTFLSSYIPAEMLGRISYLSILMGLPFLVFAWLMLLQFSVDISGRSRSKWFTTLFLSVNFLLLLALAFSVKITGSTSIRLLKYCFIGLNFLYTLSSSVMILIPAGKESVLHEHDRKIIGPAVFAGMLIYCIPLFFYYSQILTAIIFIFAFFAGNTFLPVYLSYCTLNQNLSGNKGEIISFEDFCMEYDVSPRESEIVREICNGLSNKEISDKLFISLQTVKDHTHRIYIKTNVKNRVQLINLVRDLSKS
jgi:DNA-binding CsgD family transcriptional regulator